MPRTARKISALGVYHIVLRGNNQQEIFHDQADYNRYISLLKQNTDKNSHKLYAWCLMPNHIHLLIREGSVPFSNAVQSISSSFVFWYNRKYSRTGHLFEGRYRSEPVEDENYFFRVLRYIHMNPVKANICGSPEDYPYSSYQDYFNNEKYKTGKLIFNRISRDEFIQFHNEKIVDEDLGLNNLDGLTDNEVRQIAKILVKNGDLSALRFLSGPEMEKKVRYLLQKGASIRQICMLTGLTVNEVQSIKTGN